MRKIYSSVLSLSMMCSATGALATAFDDIGYTRLQTELGVNLPDGAGVKVAQVEAPVSNAWIPDVLDAQFVSKTFVEITTGSVGFSNHAREVGKSFYGLTQSTAPGILDIALYEAVKWMSTDFLRITEAVVPNVVATRLANHSWVGDYGNFNGEILLRVDFVIGVDEFIQAVAMSYSPSTKHLLSDSFNVIAAGMSNGKSGTGTVALDTIYTGGRAKPDIVAPEDTISGAAPRLASAAALLIGHAHSTPSLSTDIAVTGTTNRNGDVIYNAERSETIKAVLMAGADRYTLGNTNPAAPNNVDIIDYRADVTKQTSNGLDTRFGAGQINIYNSYHVLNAGEQNSAEDFPAGAGAIGNVGFDYDPAFGGNSSNAAATYDFTTGANAGQKLKASLVWNLQVAASNVLYDLDLQLIDVTAGGTVVASSTSTIDNTESIWFDLSSNNAYQLKVIRGSGQAAFNWDYALAWQISTLPIVTAGQVFSIDENSAPATVIGTVTATVPTGTITKYAIFSGNTGNVFAISDSGVLTVAGAIDYETTASYSLGIAATDGLNVSNAETVVVDVNNINDVAPVVAASQTLSIDENSPFGASVGSVVADDVDSGIVGFSIVGGSTVFEIGSNGLITVIGTLDYETTPSYTLSITATDGINASGAVDVVININNLDEVAPTVAAAQNFSIDENSANGTLVGTVIATDAADAGGSVSGFNIVSGNTGNVFAIAGNGEITVVGAVDYETATSYTLGVTATDDSGNTSGAVNVVIYVNDINDAPVVTASQTLSIDENSSVGASVGTVAAGDVDSAITGFVIVGGSTVFAIDSIGLITVAGVLDYETTASYTLGITASDGVNTSAPVNVVIIVNDIVESSTSASSSGGGSLSLIWLLLSVLITAGRRRVS